jgi:hypothetical protein
MRSTSSIILLLPFIALFFNNCSNSKNLDGWIGKYIYEEETIKANAGYNMVMGWELSIEKQENVYHGTLEISGQQTFINLLADISGDTNEISLIYDKLIDGSDENLKKGDTLFILSKQSGKLITKWRHLESRLPETSPKECICFERR